MPQVARMGFQIFCTWRVNYFDFDEVFGSLGQTEHE
jgi:hypothetical protein